MDYLDQKILGYTGIEIIYFLAAIVITVLVLTIIKSVILIKIKRLSRKTDYMIDDLVIDIVSHAFKFPVMILLGINVGMIFADIGESVSKAFTYINVIVFGFYAWKVLSSIIDYGVKKYVGSMDEDNMKTDIGMINLVKRLVKLGVVLIVGLVVLQNLGIDISALIAGIGVGGIAIAFALQNILEDVFSSISLHFDKPFKEGDFIMVGQDSGVVKSIGMKTSRVTTNTGDELVITNRELTQARVRNFKKLKKRKITFNVGVVYGTSVEKLKKVEEIVTKIFDEIELVRLERVNLMELGDFSINFEVRYEVSSSKFKDHADAKQEINFKLLEAFEKEKIEFAYPTQTVIVEK